MRRAAGGRGDVQPVGAGQRLADAHAVETVVGVARIVGGDQAGVADHFGQFGAAPFQHRAQQRDGTAGNLPARPRAGQPGHPARPVEPHQQRLGLVVRMMRGRQRGQPALPHPAGHRRGAGKPRLGLDIAIGHIDRKRGVGNAASGADPRDFRRFCGALGAEPVIDGGRLDPARQRRLRQQQQGKAVRSARHRQAQPRVRMIDGFGPDRRERGAEAPGISRRQVHCASNRRGP